MRIGGGLEFPRSAVSTEVASDQVLAYRHLECSQNQVYQVSALEVSLNDMRYINSRFTYLLTYLRD